MAKTQPAQIQIDLGKSLADQMEDILLMRWRYQLLNVKKIQLEGIAPRIGQQPAINDNEIKALMKEFSFDEYIDLKDAKPGAEPKYTLKGVSKVKSDFTTRNLPAFAGVIAGAIGVTGLTLAGLFTGVLLGAIGLAAIAPPFGLPILAAVLLGAAIAATVAFVGVVIFSTLKQVKEQKELDQQAQDIASAMPVIAQAKSNAERDIAKSEQEAKEKKMALEAKQQETIKTIGSYKDMFEAMRESGYFNEDAKAQLETWRSIFDNQLEKASEFEKIKPEFLKHAAAYVLSHMTSVLYAPDQDMKMAKTKAEDPIVKQVYGEVFQQFEDQSVSRREAFTKQYYMQGEGASTSTDLLKLYNDEINAAAAFRKQMQDQLDKRLTPEGLEAERKKQAAIDFDNGLRNLASVGIHIPRGPGNKSGGNQ